MADLESLEARSDLDIDENGEPQFADPADDSDKKKSGVSKYKNAVVPLFVVIGLVVVVAKFDQIKILFTGDKSGKSTQVAEHVPQAVMPDYQVTAPVEPDLVVSAPAKQPVERQQPPVAPVADSVNVVLANKIGELSDSLSVLTGHLVSVNSELKSIKEAQVKSDEAVLAGLQRIADGLEQIKVRDGQSEKVLAGVISDLRGFKQTLKDERLKFTLKILHVETYGGQPRVVAFEESSPQKVLKLYTGDDVGLWRVKQITDSKAVFVHADGVEHTEVIR